VCILTAETAAPYFLQVFYIVFIPLALLAGAFTVVAPEAYRKTRTIRNNSSNNNGFISLSFSNFRHKTK
jgi:hypothetical protein